MVDTLSRICRFIATEVSIRKYNKFGLRAPFGRRTSNLTLRDGPAKPLRGSAAPAVNARYLLWN